MSALLKGGLYLVATPIGNLEDMTFRGVRILQEVDRIAAEDTRRTRKLLNHYSISKPVTSYHEHNAAQKGREILRWLKRGEAIALVTDAGMPTLSDPGCELVREAVAASIPVTVIPGASALTTALAISGVKIDRFVFESFLPSPSSQRRRRLEELRSETRPILFFEAPHRMKRFLTEVLEILGDRPAVLCRELTKRYEEVLRGKVSDLIKEWSESPRRGEMVIFIGCSEGSRTEPSATEIRCAIREELSKGLRLKEVVSNLSQRFRWSRRKVYQEALSMKRSKETTR